MKNCIVTLFMIVIACRIEAVRSEKSLGPASYTNQTFDSIETMGPLTGSALKARTLEIYGSADLSKSEIGSATVYGPLKMTETVFKGPIKAHGNVQAVDSTLRSNLTIESNDPGSVILEDSSAKTIYITSEESEYQTNQRKAGFSAYFSTQKKYPEGPQVVIKGAKSSVEGPIEFIGKEGTVILAENATYSGAITNGKLEKESSTKTGAQK